MCCDATFHDCQMVAMMIFKVYHNASKTHRLCVTIKIAILPVPGYCKTFKSHSPLILEVFF